MYIYSSKPRPKLADGDMFVGGYGVLRFFVEFFREPDTHIGFDAFGWMTRGQMLCIPMILFGAYLIINGYRREGREAAAVQPATKRKAKNKKAK